MPADRTRLSADSAVPCFRSQRTADGQILPCAPSAGVQTYDATEVRSSLTHVSGARDELTAISLIAGYARCIGPVNRRRACGASELEAPTGASTARCTGLKHAEPLFASGEYGRGGTVPGRGAVAIA